MIFPGFLSFSAVSLVLRAMVLRNHPWLPSTISGKIALLITFTTGILVFAVYRSGLLSKLTVNLKVDRFETFQDILGSDILEVGVMKGTAHQEKFELAPEGSVYKKIWLKYIKHPRAGEKNLILTIKAIFNDSVFR